MRTPNSREGKTVPKPVVSFNIWPMLNFAFIYGRFYPEAQASETESADGLWDHMRQRIPPLLDQRVTLR